jgi:hypothetical protein
MSPNGNCECGEWTGERCEMDVEGGSAVTVEYMPRVAHRGGWRWPRGASLRWIRAARRGGGVRRSIARYPRRRRVGEKAGK